MIEDVVVLLLLAALGIWGFVTRRKVVRMLVASVFLFVVVFGVMCYEPAARSAITKRQPWTQEFRDGVSEMLNRIVAFRPYILLAGAGLFALAIKGRKEVSPKD